MPVWWRKGSALNSCTNTVVGLIKRLKKSVPAMPLGIMGLTAVSTVQTNAQAGTKPRRKGKPAVAGIALCPPYGGHKTKRQRWR